MADEAKGAGAPESGTSKSSGRPMTWLWMILALVVVGGFLVWLGAASEPSAVPVVETEDEDQAEPLPEGVVAVSRDSLAENKAMFQGQDIQVPGVQATGRLGPAIFWGELGDESNQVPILVRLDSAAAEGFEMTEGSAYTITGMVFEMNDEVAAAWEEAGEFDGEGEAMQAAFTDYYIQASGIRQSGQDGNG